MGCSTLNFHAFIRLFMQLHEVFAVCAGGCSCMVHEHPQKSRDELIHPWKGICRFRPGRSTSKRRSSDFVPRRIYAHAIAFGDEKPTTVLKS